MPAILTVTLNPTVDFATSSVEIAPGAKLRCAEPEIDPGGGGINVSRAIQILGGQSTAMVAIGGTTGAQLLELLAIEGVATVAIQGPGETRQSVSVTESTSGDQYRFVMPGPTWKKKDVNRALAAIDRAAGDGAFVVLSGSQPPGVAKDFPAILSNHVAGRHARLIVDTSGPALFHLAEKPHEALHVLRMDDEEAEQLAGRALPERADTAAFAAELVEKRVAEIVVVARGADGSVLANGTGRWHVVAPLMEVVSAVGAGDSFVGAFTLALSRGEPPQDCLRWGVAAAAGAVTTAATRLCTREDVERLYGECVTTEL